MNKTYVKLFSILILLLFASVPLTSGAENSQHGGVYHVESLTENWPRLAGTQGENEAATYIREELEGYGFSTKVENFMLENGYDFKDGYLDLEKPFEENYQFAPIIRSPSAGEITSELRYLENVSENNQSLKNKIILTSENDLENIYKYSPSAVILYRENTPAWSYVRPEASLETPTVTISYQDAEELISILDNGEAVMSLSLEGETRELTSHNVLATLPGKREEKVIVACHHDTVFSPGAVDSATGVAVMLEVARRLSDEDLDKTVEFVSFGAEKYGSRGVEKYLENFQKEEVAAIFNVNSISSGLSNGLRIGVEGVSNHWFDKYLARIADNLGLDYSFGKKDDFRTFRDNYGYVSFRSRGFPATRIYWVSGSENPLWMINTVEDKPELVDENSLKDSSRLLTSSIRKVGSDWERGWVWGSNFPGTLSLFVVLSFAFVVVGLASTSYLRYVKDERGLEVIFIAGVIVLLAILGLFFLMF